MLAIWWPKMVPGLVMVLRYDYLMLLMLMRDWLLHEVQNRLLNEVKALKKLLSLKSILLLSEMPAWLLTFEKGWRLIFVFKRPRMMGSLSE